MHISWAKQAGCEWKAAIQTTSTFLQPFTQMLGELVLPEVWGGTRYCPSSDRARLGIVIYPYSSCPLAALFQSSFPVLPLPFFFCSTDALFFLIYGSLRYRSCLYPCACQCSIMLRLSSLHCFMTAPCWNRYDTRIKCYQYFYWENDPYKNISNYW